MFQERQSLKSKREFKWFSDLFLEYPGWMISTPTFALAMNQYFIDSILLRERTWVLKKEVGI